MNLLKFVFVILALRLLVMTVAMRHKRKMRPRTLQQGEKKKGGSFLRHELMSKVVCDIWGCCGVTVKLNAACVYECACIHHFSHQNRFYTHFL